jgi:hypothetical protein
MKEKPVNGHGKWTLEALKEFYDDKFIALYKFLDEREQRYMTMFKAAEDAVRAAFASSEKAIEKSDAALKEYKTSANEFRKTLEDYRNDMSTKADTINQEKTFRVLIDSQRKESEAIVMGLRTLIDSERKETEAMGNSLRALIEIQAKDIKSLQLGESRGEGGSIVKEQMHKQSNFMLALVISNGLIIVGLLIGIAKLMMGK